MKMKSYQHCLLHRNFNDLVFWFQIRRTTKNEVLRFTLQIHLFIGTSVTALVLACISIQLLRLGLVYHTSDGNTYQKDQKDIWIIMALSDAGAEGLFCVIAVISSWKMARLADVPPEPVKDDGPFHIQITKGGSHYMTMSKYTNKRKISSL